MGDRYGIVCSPEQDSHYYWVWMLVTVCHCRLHNPTLLCLCTVYNIMLCRDHEIQFYEMLNFEPYCQLRRLESVPLKLDFWSVIHSIYVTKQIPEKKFTFPGMIQRIKMNALSWLETKK